MREKSSKENCSIYSSVQCPYLGGLARPGSSSFKSILNSLRLLVRNDIRTCQSRVGFNIRNENLSGHLPGAWDFLGSLLHPQAMQSRCLNQSPAKFEARCAMKIKIHDRIILVGSNFEHVWVTAQKWHTVKNPQLFYYFTDRNYTSVILT